MKLTGTFGLSILGLEGALFVLFTGWCLRLGVIQGLDNIFPTTYGAIDQTLRRLHGHQRRYPCYRHRPSFTDFTAAIRRLRRCKAARVPVAH